MRMELFNKYRKDFFEMFIFFFVDELLTYNCPLIWVVNLVCFNIKVYSELCSGQVLTTEYITGLTIDQCVDLPQSSRDYIAEAILKLVFRNK